MRKSASCLVALGIAAFLSMGSAARAAEPASNYVMGDPDTAAVPVCALSEAASGHMRCNAWIVSDAQGAPRQFDGPAGYHPADLRSAYNIHSNGSKDTIVAVVDAYHYPTAESDMNTYRKQFGIPPCTRRNGCFQQVNQHGGTKKFPVTNLGWNQEAALDLDMVSAMCPKCRILFVEADNNHSPNLGKAVDTAVRMGAHVVSNSYSGKEKWSPDQEYHYDHAGVAITASTGDSGLGAGFPATGPHVVAVGGTALRVDATTKRGWSEVVWTGTGSGCSQFYDKPAWQHDPNCSRRMEADVSAVASPGTGVAVYAPNGHGSQWAVFGGTSVSAPLVGGIFGNNGGTVNDAETIYKNSDQLFDVTTGSNGSCGGHYKCTARVGYDGPTGWGTPNGLGAFGN